MKYRFLLSILTLVAYNVGYGQQSVKFSFDNTDKIILKQNVAGHAMFDLINTNGNSFFGSDAGMNSTGRSNTFMGFVSGFKNTSGIENVFIGSTSGYENTTGNGNIFMGFQTGFSNTEGNFNVALGLESLATNASGNNNVSIGYLAGFAALGSGNVFIGSTAGASETGSNKLYIDNSNTSAPLIYGDFSADFLRINGKDNDGSSAALEIKGGSQTLLIDGNEIDVKDNNNLSINGNNSGRVSIGVNGNTTTTHTVYGNAFQISNPSSPVLRMDRSSGSAYDLEFYLDGPDLKIRGGANASGSSLSHLFTFTDNKRLGIGTEAPEDQLHISNTGAAGIIIEADSDNNDTEVPELIFKSNNGSTLTSLTQSANGSFLIFNPNLTINQGGSFILDEFGQFGINSTFSSSAFHIQKADELFALSAVGNILFTGGTVSLTGFYEPGHKLTLPNVASDTEGRGIANAWLTYSDARVKKNLNALTYGLSEIMELKPLSYDHYSSQFKDGKLTLSEAQEDIGFIAQEVHKVIKEVVSKPKDEKSTLWSMNYEKLTPVIVKAIQEQQEIINEQSKKIAELEKQLLKIEAMETRMEKIESSLKGL